MTPYPTIGIVTAADLAALYARPDVFPKLPGRDFTTAKAASWSTGVKRSASGREVRSSYWSAPIYEFKVRHPVLRDMAGKPEVAKLLAFFNARMGRFGFFFYLDEDDHEVPADTPQIFAEGDGATQTFQLARIVGDGTPYEAIEPVYALWGAPVVKINGTPTTAFTVSAWGQITFSSAPANGAELSWSGRFLYVCRFDQDKLSIEQLMKALWAQDGLTFCSLKP